MRPFLNNFVNSLKPLDATPSQFVHYAAAQRFVEDIEVHFSDSGVWAEVEPDRGHYHVKVFDGMQAIGYI